MKGLELPISTLVVVIMAVIILLALVAMYFSGFGPFSTAVGLEGVRGEACRKLAQESRCTNSTATILVNNFDANKNNANDPGTSYSFPNCNSGGSDDNLASLCTCYYNITSENDCKRLCGCS